MRLAAGVDEDPAGVDERRENVRRQHGKGHGIPGRGGSEESRARREGRALVGAGTVLDESTARAAIDAGATFIVTPTLTLDVIAVCRREGNTVFPRGGA